MIEQQATVIASRGNLIRVAIQRQSGCHSCDAKAGCGTAAIGKWFPNRAENEVDLFVDQFDSAPTMGSTVTLKIPESTYSKSIWSLYGLPLFALLVGAIVGNAVAIALFGPGAFNDGLALLGGCLGLAIGLKAAKRKEPINTSLIKVSTQPAGLQVAFEQLNSKP